MTRPLTGEERESYRLVIGILEFIDTLPMEHYAAFVGQFQWCLPDRVFGEKYTALIKRAPGTGLYVGRWANAEFARILRECLRKGEAL